MGGAAHIPVMPAEVVDALAPRPGETYADATAGRGGHAALVAARLGPMGTVVLNDLDEGNLRAAEQAVRAVAEAPRVVALRGNFADLPRRMAEGGHSADMVLADLGFASGQVEDAARGFSFQRDGPLDMRLDPGGPITAAELLASMGEEEIAEMLRDLGEERHARRIAQKIVRERERSPITTTSRLAAVVRAAVPFSPSQSIDPATRSFQALRIAVNDELGSLSALLEGVARAAAQAASRRDGAQQSWLRPGARVGVISFHSLEDRPVKRMFGDLIERGLAAPALGGARRAKPVTASDDEQRANPRSRSARLRAVRLASPTPG